MVACRCFRLLSFSFFAVVLSVAQQVSRHSSQTTAAAPEKVPLEEVSTGQVPSLPAEQLTTPVLCSPDGAIFIRLVSMEAGAQDPLSVASDGKTVPGFGREKINDIPQPKPYNAFMNDSDVYMLTQGHFPLGYEAKWRKPSGEVASQP